MNVLQGAASIRVLRFVCAHTRLLKHMFFSVIG